MNTFAVICGLLGVLGYFFYIIVAKSASGDDGQGVNKPIQNKILSPEPCAQDQKGRWN